MSAITKKRLEKAKKLAQMFEDFKISGLSPTDFCEKEGIHTSKFYYWRARLKSGIDLSKMIENKFGKKISEIHIQQFLKEMRLNDPAGRKAGKHKIKNG